MEEAMRQSEDNATNAAILNMDLGVYEAMLRMQYEEITAEDYEVLLVAHEVANPNPTLEVTAIERLPQMVWSCGTGEETCSICIEELLVGEPVRRLHCGHVYHRHCIDKWLSESSVTCPLDKIPAVPDGV
jgi:hypothetical protein